MTRRPLSPMPVYQNFSERGHWDRLRGHWQHMANQADIVIDVEPRPQVDTLKELGQVAIIKGVLGDKYSAHTTGMSD